MRSPPIPGKDCCSAPRSCMSPGTSGSSRCTACSSRSPRSCSGSSRRVGLSASWRSAHSSGWHQGSSSGCPAIRAGSTSVRSTHSAISFCSSWGSRSARGASASIGSRAGLGTGCSPQRSSTTAVFFVARQLYAVGSPLDPVIEGMGQSLSAVQLGPVRLLNFAAFALVVYVVTRPLRWTDVRQAPYRWLAFVGRNSLPVFAWSIMIAYATVALLPVGSSAMLGMFAAVLAVTSLSIPAWLSETYHQRRRESRPPGTDGAAADAAATSLAPEWGLQGSTVASRP